jgi:hypothetical protein
MRTTLTLAALLLTACSDPAPGDGGPAIGYWVASDRFDGWSCLASPAEGSCLPPAYFPAAPSEVHVEAGGRITWGGAVTHDGDADGLCINVAPHVEHGQQLAMASLCTGTVAGVPDPTVAAAQVVWGVADGGQCWCGGAFDYAGPE